jgi:uncharacterized protein YqjF (DUF2071 family)
MRMSELLLETAHRPWPMPGGPWVQKHTWSEVLFAHWQVPADAVRPLVPEKLEVETRDGSAWVGISTFRMRGARLRGMPALPFFSTFPEVNIRTYVRHEDRPGVFFFSLNSPSMLFTTAARLVYHMPYVRAEVSSEKDGESIHLRSTRTGRGKPATWECRYQPVPGVFEAQPETLESFLVERWSLYTVDQHGRIDRVEFHRPPWPLQNVEAEIRENSLAEAHGIRLPPQAPRFHFSWGVDVLIWPSVRVG